MADENDKIDETKIEETTADTAQNEETEALLPSEAAPEAAPETAPVAAPQAVAPTAAPAKTSEEEEEENDSIGNLKNPPPSTSRPHGRGPTLGEADPYWQFGTPVESWGSTQGRRGGTVAGTGLADNDPYWQFGTPPSSWGKNPDGSSANQAAHSRPRVYFECQRCGVKVERKAMHRGGAFCPFCNRPMRQVGGQEPAPRDRRRPPQQDRRPQQAPQQAPAEAPVAPTAPDETEPKE